MMVKLSPQGPVFVSSISIPFSVEQHNTNIRFIFHNIQKSVRFSVYFIFLIDLVLFLYDKLNQFLQGTMDKYADNFNVLCGCF